MDPALPLAEIRTALDLRESEYLSPLATPSASAIRRQPDHRSDGGYRQEFGVDVDRILNSLAYTRYIDKTQVFSLIENDHLTHRVLHVQLVSKIGRTIGRFLGLNEDLIEAIALGHDIGHTPFGHDGERFLSEICKECGIGHFHHNAQSLQFLDRVERKGLGWNLSLQTLDGILCHDGEIHNTMLKPDRNKDFFRLDGDVKSLLTNPDHSLVPMTLEGCVVRMADTISYIGRDIEDAIRIGLIHRSDLPESSTKVLGKTNGTIVYTLVTDIIANSFQKPLIRFSDPVSRALQELKQFNLSAIYLNPSTKDHLSGIRDLFRLLFDRYLCDLTAKNPLSPIFSHYLNDMEESYRQQHEDAEIVRDFIAGMTDRYFIAQCPEHLRPSAIAR